MTPGDTLRYLSPELILLLTAMIVLTLDLTGRREPRHQQQLLPLVAIVGLIAALGATLMLMTQSVSARVATMMSVDPLALFFKMIAVVGVGLVIVSAMDYIPSRTPYVGEFYALLVAAALAISITVSANDLILIYLGMEFLSITSYVLTGFLRRDRRSIEAALKYFLYGASASAVMLYGMSLLYGATGATDLEAIARALSTKATGDLRLLGFPAIVLLVVGFGFKASLVPFHQWAPDVYEGAPTPITAFLSTASKATGFAIMVRVLTVGLPMFQGSAWVPILAAISMVTMTLGNLVAIQQTNVKRLLAYSSIAQAGYILIGLAALSAGPAFNGLDGLLIYLLAYLFTNLGAFLVVIAIENATGAVDLPAYAGLVHRSPLLAAMLTVFLLSLAGIPPTGGFLGKFFVFGAAIRAQFLPLAIVAIVNSAIAAFYYLNVVRYMFLLPSPEGEPAALSVTPAMRAMLWVCTAMTLLIGVYAQPFIEWALRSATLLAAAL
ncbi:MAG: NADH-quinone oxidoreductase subunit N [Anaerolineae bacterium]|nr:NADH-quinone oxidoreductase subunit N [Anaerolineae bacterium]MDW8099469.1 NADH-quinone oxidoreductase subunit N [Anaerolineae bacterium]